MADPITIRVDQSEGPLLTREQLAERLQVSKRQVELMESTGVPTIRFGRGKAQSGQWRSQPSNGSQSKFHQEAATSPRTLPRAKPKK